MGLSAAVFQGTVSPDCAISTWSGDNGATVGSRAGLKARGTSSYESDGGMSTADGEIEQRSSEQNRRAVLIGAFPLCRGCLVNGTAAAQPTRRRSLPICEPIARPAIAFAPSHEKTHLIDGAISRQGPATGRLALRLLAGGLSARAVPRGAAVFPSRWPPHEPSTPARRAAASRGRQLMDAHQGPRGLRRTPRRTSWGARRSIHAMRAQGTGGGEVAANAWKIVYTCLPNVGRTCTAPRDVSRPLMAVDGVCEVVGPSREDRFVRTAPDAVVAATTVLERPGRL